MLALGSKNVANAAEGGDVVAKAMSCS
jgi:hypothetical protein